MKEDISGNVHRKYYGKCDKLNAPCNRNREFQAGYWHGVESFGIDANKIIEEEFALRKEVGDNIGNGFREWERGLWASRSQLAAAGIRKRRKFRQEPPTE
jgi:hypothetical protein